MKKLVLLFILALPVLSYADNVYYPADFQAAVANHSLKDDNLKSALFTVLNSTHTRLAVGADLLGCETSKGKCFTHTAVGYGPARHYLYTQLHVTNNDSRGPILKEVYCNREEAATGNDPASTDINCEHTWPQSKFTKSFPTELQKSDMHHLFPADSKANGVRGNFDFAEVNSNGNLKNCSASASGASVTSGGSNYFEPPVEHRGNVARALFYFAVRYKISMSKDQETFLRKWNEQDPVDDAEMARNDAIEKLQGDRNPFIDYPNLAQDISKF